MIKFNHIFTLYNRTENKVGKHNRETEKLKTTRGVRKGSDLNLLLFIIIVDEIIRKVSNNNGKDTRMFTIQY